MSKVMQMHTAVLHISAGTRRASLAAQASSICFYTVHPQPPSQSEYGKLKHRNAAG